MERETEREGVAEKDKERQRYVNRPWQDLDYLYLSV